MDNQIISELNKLPIKPDEEKQTTDLRNTLKNSLKGAIEDTLSRINNGIIADQFKEKALALFAQDKIEQNLEAIKAAVFTTSQARENFLQVSGTVQEEQLQALNQIRTILGEDLEQFIDDALEKANR